MRIDKYNPKVIERNKNRWQKIKRIVNTILCVILIPIILGNMFLIIQSMLFPSRTASLFNLKYYVIVSGSMKPSVNIGDVVIVKKLKDGYEYQVGDIISYRENEKIVTHRVVRVNKEIGKDRSYVTKGDNNNAEDSLVVNSDIIEGRVLLVIPKIGYLSIIIENHIFLTIVFILFYAFLSSNVKKFLRRRKREELRAKYNANI